MILGKIDQFTIDNDPENIDRVVFELMLADYRDRGFKVVPVEPGESMHARRIHWSDR